LNAIEKLMTLFPKAYMGYIAVVGFNSCEFHSSKIGKLYFLLPVFFAILVSLVFAQLVLPAEPYRKDSLFSSFNYGEMFSPLTLSVTAIATVLILFVFFRMVKTGNEFAMRILVASFVVVVSLFTLLIGRLVFVLLELESQLLLIVLSAVAFTGMFGAFLVLIGVLSHKARNRLFVISSGTFGAFVGVLIPTLAVIGILAVLSIADTILILSKSVQRIFGEAKYEELIKKISFSTSEWGIGLGDLICYSIIASNTSAYFGVYAGAASLALILIGAFLTMKLAVKHTRVPGLPIATALGLLPSIVLLISS
jgi:hypothetical protein